MPVVRFSSFLFGLVLLTLPACASGERAPDADLGATLEVGNRTGEDLVLSVRGRAEAQLRPGARVRVRHLGPGEALVSAAGRGTGAFSASATLTLRAGETTSWTVLPDAASGREPTPEPPALAALVFVNPSAKALTVLIDGVPRGRVFPGAERRFEDLPAGPARLEARPDDGSAPVTAELTLEPDLGGHATTWRFEPAGVPLTVKNATDEALVVMIDGEERTRVAAGETWRGTEAPGLRVLSARSVPSRRPYEAVLELAAGAETTYEITTGQSALVLENRAGEAIELQVSGHPEKVSLPHRGQVRLEGLGSGTVRLSGVGASGMAYAGQVELLAGQVATWIAGPVAGSVRVENRSARPVTVYVREGDGAERERGEIAPGKVALIKDLKRGPVVLRAVQAPTSLGGKHPTVDAGRLQTTRLDLGEQPSATWVVADVAGAIGLANRRDEAVEVYIDATRVGEVPAGGERVFTGVPAGMRLVETIGTKSGALRSTPLSVPEDGLASLEVKDITAFIEIENGAGEVLEPQGPLAEQATRLEAGQVTRFRVRAGAQKVVLVGQDTGFSYGAALEVEAGETTRWVARLSPGRVVLWSQLAETVAVTLDDHAQGTLAPDDSLALTELAPGRHRVQTVGLRSGRVRTHEVVVPPGGEKKVTLAAELGVVLAENLASEVVEVSIDGELYGAVQGGRVHAFGKVPPGRREVVFDFPKSRRTQKVSLELREGQRARVVAHAPVGLVIVDNGARQDVRVIVDGEAVATIGRDAGPTLVPVPAGARHIQIERMGDRTQLGFQLEVLADHAIHLPVPPRDLRLVVVNRGELELALFAGDKPLGTIGARASVMVEQVRDGDTRLLAKDASGRITHEGRRVLRAGETATWVLDALPSEAPGAPTP